MISSVKGKGREDKVKLELWENLQMRLANQLYVYELSIEDHSICGL